MKALSCLFLQFPFRKCALLMLLLGMTSLGICLTPQQHVYATGTGLVSPYPPAISGFDKNSVSGALTAIPLVSPFPAHNAAPMAVDGQCKFLFVAGPTSIAMYAIDPASGAVTRLSMFQASRWAAPTQKTALRRRPARAPRLLPKAHARFLSPSPPTTTAFSVP